MLLIIHLNMRSYFFYIYIDLITLFLLQDTSSKILKQLILF